MVSAYLENMLHTATPAAITEAFLWIILGVFLFSFISGVLRTWNELVSYTPTLLTSLGILGTFVGIVVGLMGFNPNDIDHSISQLLEGLKTAFITSLVGIGSSILFKFLSTTPLLSARKVSTTNQGVGPALLQAMEKQSQGLEALRKAISGEEESSLVGQLKLLRSDTNDIATKQQKHFQGFESKLWEQMETFAEMLSKSATEQVINALKEVIVDFNKNLTEQFGENFKALDTSVQRLVEWQENYRQQLTELKEQYQQGVQAITTTEASLAHIREESQKIPTIMSQLSEVIEVNQHQIQELDRHLDAFVQVRDKAVDAVPEIGKRIDEMSKSITTTTNTLVEGMKTSGDQIKEAITISVKEFETNTQTLSASLMNMADHLAGQSEKIGSQLNDMTDELNNNFRNMAAILTESYKQLNEEAASMTKSVQLTNQQLQKDIVDIQKQVTNSLEQMQQRMEAMIKEVMEMQKHETQKVLGGMSEAMSEAIKTAAERTGDSVNTQISVIDEAMQREIERVMNEMGQALARISNQFTRDYSKLVEAMYGVVKQAEKI